FVGAIRSQSPGASGRRGLAARGHCVRKDRSAVSEQPHFDRWSLLTTIAAKMTDAPVASSRALIDDSRRLLAALQNSDLPPARDPNSPPYPVAVSGGVLVNPAVRPSDPASTAYSAAFSIRVFEEEARFGWSLKSPLGEMLGEGTAETELKARSDAF